MKTNENENSEKILNRWYKIAINNKDDKLFLKIGIEEDNDSVISSSIISILNLEVY